MYCKYCGNKIEENVSFCSKCGKRVDEVVEEVEEELVINPQVDERKSSFANISLGNSIVGMIFAVISFIYFIYYVEIILIFGTTVLADVFALSLPFAGMLFAKKGRKNANNYKTLIGETEGKATVGRSLGIAGGIVNTIIFVSSIVMCFVGCSM